MRSLSKTNNILTTNSTRKILLNISYIALFGALCFIFTYFFQIPYIGGIGYFNLGDGILIFVALQINPLVAIFSSLIGSTLSDFLSGYTTCIPFTIVAKISLILLSYYSLKIKNKYLKYISLYLSFIPMVLIYFTYYLVLLDSDFMSSLYMSSFDIVQGIIGVSFSLLLKFILKDLPLFKKVK